MNCTLCQNPISNGKDIQYSFYGSPHPICPGCYQALSDISSFRKDRRESGKQFVSNLLNENSYTPDITIELRHVLELPISGELKQEAKEYIKNNRPSKEAPPPDSPSDSSGYGFILAGFLFLVVAIILFILSIRKLDRYSAAALGVESVANIQLTVFSAASFIAAVVCFCCSGLASHIDNQKKKD